MLGGLMLGGLVSSEVLCWEVLCKGGFVSSEVLCREVLCCGRSHVIPSKKHSAGHLLPGNLVPPFFSKGYRRYLEHLRQFTIGLSRGLRWNFDPSIP